jgi:hypothetical protein
MSDTLKKLGDKASETWKAIKSLPPSDSEFQGLKETQQNVDSAAKPATTVTSAPTGTADVDKINPLARYGDRPGEKRLNSVGDEIPSYDEGGDVPEDQLAKVHEGEKVLNPEEAAAYRVEHPEEEKGAPAGFPGMVLPNPDNVKPVLDTEIEKKTDTDRLPTGIKADIDNAPLKTPKGDTSNPPTAQVAKPGAMHEISATTLKPYGQVMDDKANAKAQEIVASQPAPEAAPAEEKPKVTYGHLLAEQWLQRNGVTPNKPSDVVPPPPDASSLPVDTRKGPGLPQMALPPAGAPTAASAPAGKEAYKAKIAEYDKQYQDLMDKAATDNDPALREQAARVKEAKLSYEKQHPWGSPESAHPGVLGKLGHIGEEVASRTPFGVSAITSTIPGSEGYRAAQTKGAEEQVKEGAAENVAQTDADKKSASIPKMTPGDNLRTSADGTREHLYTNPDSSTQWVKEGEAPAWPPKSPVTPGTSAPATQTAGVPVPAATIGSQPSIPAVVNNATKDNPTYTYGKPPALKEGEEPATPAQITDVSTRLKNNPYIPKEAMASLEFPEGYKPTQNDVKERLSNIKEIEDATRAGNQDKLLNDIRKMQEENQHLMTQAHLLDLEDKHQQAAAKEATNASVQLAGLYAQDNYKDAMHDWYKSGNFAKDSGLITEIVNKEHSDKGSFSGALGDTLVGGLFGPEGAAIGAGVGALTGLFAGPANGYLDTLKKQGISQEGYNAMQSYFNALPARMAYEVGVQGVSASALRSSQLIQKVLNTVPPPNTPQESFDSAFQNYYKPMDVLTHKKVELSAPKGYVPPKKEDFYPPKTAKAAAPPQGSTHTGRSSIDHKLYYLDANGKKLGEAPEPTKPAAK